MANATPQYTTIRLWDVKPYSDIPKDVRLVADSKTKKSGTIDVKYFAKTENLAPPYKSNFVWKKGSVCTYDGSVFKALDDTTGNFNPNVWKQTDLASAIESLNNAIAYQGTSTVQELNSGVFVTGATYKLANSGYLNGGSLRVKKGYMVFYYQGSWEPLLDYDSYYDKQEIDEKIAAVDNKGLVVANRRVTFE